MYELENLRESYRSAYVLEQEEDEMDYVPLTDDPEPLSPDDEWEDWENDDADYYNSLAAEFNWLNTMFNNYDGNIRL